MLTEGELIEIKEKLVVGEPLTPSQRDFVLNCIDERQSLQEQLATCRELRRYDRIEVEHLRHTLGQRLK
jgi:hypothetical protein